MREFSNGRTEEEADRNIWKEKSKLRNRMVDREALTQQPRGSAEKERQTDRKTDKK